MPLEADPRRTFLQPAWAAGLGALLLVSCLTLARAQPEPAQNSLDPLAALLGLGSDFATLDAGEQQRVLELIDKRGRALDLERAIVADLGKAEPEEPHDRLAAAEGVQEGDAFIAAQHSLGRYLAAEQARDEAQAARQLRAFQEYLELAAESIEKGLVADTAQLEQLRDEPALRRRSSSAQAEFVETLRAEGLPPKSLEVLHAAGGSDADARAYLQQLLAQPPEQIGAGATDLFAAINDGRRAVASRLHALAAASPAALANPSEQTFLVGNPYDRGARVTLRIRRASIPPDWQVVVSNADEPDGSAPEHPVTEEAPGERYALDLPPHGQARVASVVIPSGRVADDTLATWAVEGTIDGVLIGGMLMQMHVPASLESVELPPVQAAEPSAPASGAASEPRTAVPVLAISLGAVLLAGLLGVILLRRRRRA